MYKREWMREKVRGNRMLERENNKRERVIKKWRKKVDGEKIL